ncbi:MAG TPA: NlpC/P60 family protein [Propionibacteriaceae bacterium]
MSKSELRNGDLVFFYRGISHVGLYAGNGKGDPCTASGRDGVLHQDELHALRGRTPTRLNRGVRMGRCILPYVRRENPTSSASAS